MKTKFMLRMALMAVLVVSVAACSKDSDDDGDPSGTISLNMMNELNGRTYLGNSDVYIDKAFNFYGRDCQIAQLGRKNGLGSFHAPVLNGLSRTVAVEPGNGYQIFKTDVLAEFPSGKVAAETNSRYYNVYVASPIKDGEQTIGANVKFVLTDVPDRGLPEYGSVVGRLEYTDDEFTIQLPTSDFEYAYDDSSNGIEYEKEGNKLIVWLLRYSRDERFAIHIRIGESYTTVYGKVGNW